MNVTCPNCATIYRVDPAKVPEAGVRARCAVCAAVFPVRREASAATSAGSATAAGTTAAPASAPAAPAPADAGRPAAVPARAEEVPRAEVAAVASPSAAPAAPPVPAKPPLGPPPAPPSPARSEAPAARPEGAPRPAAPLAPPAAPRPAVSRPAGLPPVAPRPAVPSRAPTAPAAPSAGGSTAGAAARKPVNPFLSQDPGQKARRLARALISDMVVYHPAKRREGLRDGTLKALFEDEIKKSWEEYTDQVGKDVAESTTHFKDALNEILADGRQIF